MGERVAGYEPADGCRCRSVSEATFYKRMFKFGGMDVSDVKRLEALGTENAGLRRWPRRCAIAPCSKATIQEMMSPASVRCVAAHLREIYAVSAPRACKVMGTDCSTVSLPVSPTDRRRDPGSASRVVRGTLPFREESLQVRLCNGRKRASSARAPMVLSREPNQRWSLNLSPMHGLIVDASAFSVSSMLSRGTAGAARTSRPQRARF